MKIPLLALLVFATPASALAATQLPTPMGLSFGSKLKTATAKLAKLKAKVSTEEKDQLGLHGKNYKYTKVEAAFKTGPIEQVKLYFYDGKLTRMKVQSRSEKPPVNTRKLGKPGLLSPTGHAFWWDPEQLTGIACHRSATKPPRGRCEIFDMRPLVGVLGNRHQIEVQFQTLVQGTIEQVEKVRKASPPPAP